MAGPWVMALVGGILAAAPCHPGAPLVGARGNTQSPPSTVGSWWWWQGSPGQGSLRAGGDTRAGVVLVPGSTAGIWWRRLAGPAEGTGRDYENGGELGGGN